MLNFVCIFSIILEIILTIICIKQIIQVEKRVLEWNTKLIEINSLILEINQKVKKVILKIRKIIDLITSHKIITIFRIINIAIDVIQAIVLLRSLDLSKGLKSLNYRNLKKIALSYFSKEFLKKILFA